MVETASSAGGGIRARVEACRAWSACIVVVISADEGHGLDDDTGSWSGGVAYSTIGESLYGSENRFQYKNKRLLS